MTAGNKTTTRPRRAGRIIERPRLIKRLDETEAPVILLVGPAGYGKTTLARQWARTLSGVIWVASTPSHRDVVTFSEDVAAGIDALGGNASRFIGEYMRARSNPQRAAREIAGALADRMQTASVQWLIIDDYHELAESPEVEEMVSLLRDRISARLVVASRVRPQWITTRDVVYGGVEEIAASELALTDDETFQVVGKRRDLDLLIRQARGWPALLALAANLERSLPPTNAVPATLHQYVAEELFRSATPELQNSLLDLALLPNLAPQLLTQSFGTEAQRVIDQARHLGFANRDERSELHPLLREFLLAKLSEDAGATERIRHAINLSVEVGEWETALDLVLRFQLTDLVDWLLQQAFKPLVRGGRLGTLASFASRTRNTAAFPPAAIQLIDADVALRDGQFELAATLAGRAAAALPTDHELKCHAFLICGRSEFFLANLEQSIVAYRTARDKAVDERDETESVFGFAGAVIFNEKEDAGPSIELLSQRRYDSPEHLIRYTTAALTYRRFVGGLHDPLAIEEAIHAYSSVHDPTVRSAFAYSATNLLGQRGDYLRAQDLLSLFAHEVDEFSLEFAQPFLDWTTAYLHLGMRQFGQADRHLQYVEDAAEAQQNAGHELNARILRARLQLQTGAPDRAVELLQLDPRAPVLPSWRGEFLATKALALAAAGMREASMSCSGNAREVTRCLEVSVLAAGAEAVVSPTRETVYELFGLGERFDIWDPVICTLRVSPDVLETAGDDRDLRPRLQELLARCGDRVLARQAGLRSRTTRAPHAVLSPREQEVLGLMAGGMRNREIAKALYVAESTVKVHVRHILEKLGVRSRAEAVARFERIDRT